MRVVVCRRVDSSEAHAQRALLREQLDRAYDVLKLKRTEERNMVQDVAQVIVTAHRVHACICLCLPICVCMSQALTTANVTPLQLISKF